MTPINDGTMELPKGGYIKTGLIDIKNKKDMEEKHSNLESTGKNFKPFDLQAAKAGKPVCTRDGRMARIICFDKEGEQPIVALIEKNGVESIDTFFLNGQSCFEYSKVAGDLMMLPEKKEGWVNIVRGSNGNPHMGRGIFTSKEEAGNAIKVFSDNLIDTVKISWEE